MVCYFYSSIRRDLWNSRADGADLLLNRSRDAGGFFCVRLNMAVIAEQLQIADWFRHQPYIAVNLFTSLGALKVGLDILMKEEHVQVDQILGHGGLFKTKGVGQKILAGAIDAPVSVMETAGEGGAWGIALLASYMINKEENETLEDYLDAKVFAGNAGTKMDPDPADVAGFEVFTERYKKGLPIERAAVESLK